MTNFWRPVRGIEDGGLDGCKIWVGILVLTGTLLHPRDSGSRLQSLSYDCTPPVRPGSRVARVFLVSTQALFVTF
jgi:hypothetical protein